MEDLKKLIFIPITFLLVLIITVVIFIHLFRYDYVEVYWGYGTTTALIKYDNLTGKKCVDQVFMTESEAKRELNWLHNEDLRRTRETGNEWKIKKTENAKNIRRCEQ